MNKHLLRFLGALSLVPLLHAQTAESFLAEGKARLAELEIEPAREALHDALAADADLSEAHLYLGLCELLLFLDGAETQAMLGELGATLEIDWPRGRFDFDWLELKAAEDAVPAAAQWRYEENSAAVDGDAVTVQTAVFTTHDKVTYFYGQFVVGPVTGPGTVYYRAKMDVPEGAPAFMYFRPFQTFGGHYDDPSFAHLDSEWAEYSAPLSKGEWNLTWTYDLFPSEGEAGPAYWLDDIRFVPEDASASGTDDASDEGATLTNGIDNGNWIVSSEVHAAPAFAESGYLSPTAHTTGPIEFLADELCDEIQALLTHFAVVPSTGFVSEFEYDPGTGGRVRIDSGDVLYVRAMLEGLTALIKLVTAEDGAMDLSLVRDLDVAKALGSFQAVLTIFPDLLKTSRPANRTVAEAAFRRGQALYLEASALLRARPEGTRGLFNLDPPDLDHEESLRTELARAVRSLDAPEDLEVDEETGESIKIYLGALFDTTTDWRTLLPAFNGDTPIEGTLPDPTLGGLFPEIEAGDWEEVLAGDDALAKQPKTVLDGAQPVPGDSMAKGFQPLRVIATDKIANRLIIEDAGNGSSRFHLWDRAHGTYERIDVDSSSRPLQEVTYAALSGDGQRLFLAAADPPSVARRDALKIPVDFGSPIFHAPPWDSPDERTLTFETTPQPNGGTGPSQFRMTVTLPEGETAFEQENVITGFKLDTPWGSSETNYSVLYPDSGPSSFELIFQLGIRDDSDFAGEWKLSLTYTNAAEGSPVAVVTSATMVLDATAGQVLSRTIEEADWTVLTQNSAGEYSNGSRILWLVADGGGDRIAFVSDADNNVVETVGLNKWRHAYVMDVPSRSIRLLSASIYTGFEHEAGETAISEDGNRVVFYSSANLVESDENNRQDVYVYDFTTDSLTVASRSTSGFGISADSGARAFDCHISADGRFVVFRSNAEALLLDSGSEANLGLSLVFVKDTQTGLLNAWPDSSGLLEPTISADGKYVYGTSNGFSTNEFTAYMLNRQTEEIESVFDGFQSTVPRFATAEGIAVFYDSRGNILFHDPESNRLDSYHLQKSPATYVAMGQPGLVISGVGTAVSVPVTLHPGVDAEDAAVTATVTTRGASALPSWNYRDDALAPVTLTLAAPTQSVDIPFHSTAFRAELGVFEVLLDAVEGPARIGYPDRTVVVLKDFADPDRYAAWTERVFPDPADRVDAAVSGLLADPDFDGRINLIEFALASDPLVVDSDPPLTWVPGRYTGFDDDFELRINANAGLRFFIEGSRNLQSWSSYPLETMDELEVSTDADGRTRFRFSWPKYLPDDRFYRLRVEQAE